jgi:Zn finger protein HypA/HybF involved in hydrogenase expression
MTVACCPVCGRVWVWKHEWTCPDCGNTELEVGDGDSGGDIRVRAVQQRCEEDDPVYAGRSD